MSFTPQEAKKLLPRISGEAKCMSKIKFVVLQENTTNLRKIETNHVQWLGFLEKRFFKVRFRETRREPFNCLLQRGSHPESFPTQHLPDALMIRRPIIINQSGCRPGRGYSEGLLEGALLLFRIPWRWRRWWRMVGATAIGGGLLVSGSARARRRVQAVGEQVEAVWPIARRQELKERSVRVFLEQLRQIPGHWLLEEEIVHKSLLSGGPLRRIQCKKPIDKI